MRIVSCFTLSGRSKRTLTGWVLQVRQALSHKKVMQSTALLLMIFIAVKFCNYLIQALEGCSYQKKREELILLQIRLRNKTGVDPLQVILASDWLTLVM